ncbi:MAG TPA: nitrilase-related carbon-nitrogen hydrolase [Rubrobacteraceae bacterium]|nr:nitrilase-related carbon-nitrogen hydrolase [Rubrobacteraceae bacterium]
MRVACAQYAVREGDPDFNLRRALHFIRRAALKGADLVVLPELATSGCAFRSRREASAFGDAYPEGRSIRLWREEAERSGLFVVGGMLEKDGELLYNAAVLVGPGAVVGRYRKTHLWDGEKRLYEPGSELPVFDTPLGGIGLLVCYDAWFPEAARTLATKGAQILCVPSNAPDDWVPETGRRGGLTMLDVHCIAHANANRVFVAAANRVGGGYLGRSCIVDVTGGVLALGGAAEERLLVAEVEPERAVREKKLTESAHALNDRNPAAYEFG